MIIDKIWKATAHSEFLYIHLSVWSKEAMGASQEPCLSLGLKIGTPCTKKQMWQYSSNYAYIYFLFGRFYI
jgi:hypothetical protein